MKLRKLIVLRQIKRTNRPPVNLLQIPWAR